MLSDGGAHALSVRTVCVSLRRASFGKPLSVVVKRTGQGFDLIRFVGKVSFLDLAD